MAKILYISGSGRSGTTIIGNILGQLPGIFNAGQVYDVWARGVREDILCGCGVPFSECAVWQDIIKRACGSVEAMEAERFVSEYVAHSRLHRMVPTLTQAGRSDFLNRTTFLSSKVGQVYESIARDFDVIIDSSKFPQFGLIAESATRHQFFVLHLVRDPRAVAYSWMKKAAVPDKRRALYLLQYSSLKSSLLWSAFNVLTEAYWKHRPDSYMYLSYSEFARTPRVAVERILTFMNESRDLSGVFRTDRDVELHPTHAVWGNPARFSTGTVKIKADEDWKDKASRVDNARVTFVTWPLMLRYGLTAKRKSSD